MVLLKKENEFYKWASEVDTSSLPEFWTVDESALYSYWMLHVQKAGKLKPTPHRFEVLRKWERESKERKAKFVRDMKDLGFDCMFLIGPPIAYSVYLMYGGSIDSIAPVIGMILYFVFYSKLKSTLKKVLSAWF